MYKIIKIIIRLNVLLFSLNIINVYAEKENNLVYQTESELFEIPGHGLLAIDVPKVWNYNFTTTGNNQPPIITFYNLDKDKEEIYRTILYKDEGIYQEDKELWHYIEPIKSSNNRIGFRDILGIDIIINNE